MRLYDESSIGMAFYPTDLNYLFYQIAFAKGMGFEEAEELRIASRERWPHPHRPGPDALQAAMTLRVLFDADMQVDVQAGIASDEETASGG